MAHPHPQPVTRLLTGDRGSGKSTVIHHISERLGTALTGVMSRPVHLPSGERCGIDAELLPGGPGFPLARVTAEALSQLSSKELVSRDAKPEMRSYRVAAAPDPFPQVTAVQPVGPYDFSVEALTEVNNYLLRIAEASAAGRAERGESISHSTPPRRTPETIVIDEIGPLELRRHGGFWSGLTALWNDPRPLTLVVRPELVDELTECAVSAGRRVVAVHEVTTSSIAPTTDAIVTAINEETLQ